MDKVIDMFRKKLVLNITAIAVFLLSASASAAPKSQKIDAEHLELMYKMMQQMEKSGSYKKMALKSRRPAIQKASFKPEEKSFGKKLIVTATAYTSHVGQTDSTPNIAAWGDRLKSGMKVIAVSRDLLNVYGLKHRQKVRIKGLKGEYLVLDKMNKRWRKKIDIYMGMDKRKAFRWGRRKVELQWN